MSFVVPEPVRARAVAQGMNAWLDELPDIIDRLAREWDVALGRVLGGGSEALVLDAVCGDGTPAVLKVLIPHEQEMARHEIAVMQVVAGRGCAQLLRVDPAASAMLLERLGEPLGTLGLPAQERLAIMAGTAQQLWAVETDLQLPSGAEKGRWLIEYLQGMWEKLGRPCSERTVAYATACAERRVAAHDPGRAVLVHGDIHENNTLQAGDGFKLIDPDGLLAEPEYDLGVILRAEPVGEGGAKARQLAAWLAARTGTDARAILEWAAAERLSTAMVCVELGLQPFGDELMAAAGVVAGGAAG